MVLQKIKSFFEINSSKISIGFLWVFVIYMMYIIMNTASFSIGDDYRYILSIVSGNMFTEYMGYGRFLPVVNYDFNLLLLLPFGNTAISAWFLSCIKFALFIYVLYKLLPSKTVIQKYISTFLILFLPFLFRVMDLYMGITITEKFLLLTLSLFMLCYTKAKNTDNSKWWIWAFIMVLINTYSKEPMFGVFLVIAAIDFIFGKQTKNSNMFNIAIFINAAVFLILWYIFSVMGFDRFYGQDYGSSISYTIQKVFESIPIFYAVLIVFIYRLYKFFIKKDRKYVIEDSFLFAGIAYSLALIILHMHIGYYYSISILLALPIIARIFIEYKNNIKIIIPVLIIFMCSLSNYPVNSAKSKIAETNISKTFTDNIIYLSKFYNRPVVWYEVDKDKYLESYKPVFEAYYNYLSVDKKDINYFNQNNKVKNSIYIFSSAASSNYIFHINNDYNFTKCGELKFWGYRKLECYIKK